MDVLNSRAISIASEVLPTAVGPAIIMVVFDFNSYEHVQYSNKCQRSVQIKLLRKRLMRALEVRLGTGKSIRYFQLKQKVERDFRIVKVALQLPKEQLDRNIHHRVDEMISAGLLQEAESLLPFASLPALRTVGYTELFSHLKGEIPIDNAVDLIKKNTRHYAKRQLTWFRKDPDFIWYSPDEQQKIVDLGQR